MHQQQRTLEREHSVYAFRKQVDLVKRTWNDDLPAMPELSEIPSGAQPRPSHTLNIDKLHLAGEFASGASSNNVVNASSTIDMVGRAPPEFG